MGDGLRFSLCELWLDGVLIDVVSRIAPDDDGLALNRSTAVDRLAGRRTLGVLDALGASDRCELLGVRRLIVEREAVVDRGPVDRGAERILDFGAEVRNLPPLRLVRDVELFLDRPEELGPRGADDFLGLEREDRRADERGFEDEDRRVGADERLDGLALLLLLVDDDRRFCPAKISGAVPVTMSADAIAMVKNPSRLLCLLISFMTSPFCAQRKTQASKFLQPENASYAVK